MKNSNFIWTDLSTFDLDAAKEFYVRVFGWKYQDEIDYIYAHVNARPAAGLFTKPERFQEMSLPSFWMSYISVTGIEDMVDQARAQGGIIEVPPTDYLDQGKIALIRDPAGAGFTVWEGADLRGKDERGAHGRMVWNELHVSDGALVIDFYRSLFGWTFTPVQGYAGERYDIHNAGGTAIAALEVIPNRVKGRDEIWVPYFAVADLGETLATISTQGGAIVDQSSSETGKTAMVRDSQGAAFALVETGVKSAGGVRFPAWFKWRTILALLIIYAAIVFDMQWMWGLLFLLWLIPDLRSGQTRLVEPISRAEHPVWYWAIVLTWLWMSVYLLASPFL